MNANDLGKMLKQRRIMVPLTLQELARASGVSPSHLGLIERGGRFPSAHVLRKIAGPLGLAEGELFVMAGFLPSQSHAEAEMPKGRLDPYVAALLSQEPVEIQHALVTILSVMKSLARQSGAK